MSTNLQQHTSLEASEGSLDDSTANADPAAQDDAKKPLAGKPSARGRILVVDDETNARNALAELLRDEGYTVDTAPDGFKALPKLEELEPDLLLTDLKMPGIDGIELMRKAQNADADLVTVVMTAYGAVDTAVMAMREGAADYITKPINFEELAIVLERALERRRLRVEAGELRNRLSQRDRIENIVGASPPMARVFETILQVAPSRASVLITGESGTGKELVAAAIHQHSQRASGPFVKLHCAALAETLLESELFGHEKGAFTGAMGRRDGRFQQADGGTLFLDEIGEISPAIQVKLLRFLQQREFERVGGNQTIKVDVRIVAATHRDLTQEVREGRFREDLFYRLNVVTIETPPLRARVSDIPLLATRFLQRFAQENAKELRGFSDEALQRLTQYPWPGNVRELENAVERAVVVCRHHEVRAQDLSPHIVKTTARPEDGLPVVPGASLAELERYAILKTLEHTGGSTSRAAEILGISPRTIQYRLHEYAEARPPLKRAGAGKGQHNPPPNES
ncbi:MAG TPA: sigma-54 dependent transcriptional regulator [Polyangiales bacterium]|nr:sigma-54 dependent transcriptional regulator [Polyangiales bacterium]